MNQQTWSFSRRSSLESASLPKGCQCISFNLFIILIAIFAIFTKPGLYPRTCVNFHNNGSFSKFLKASLVAAVWLETDFSPGCGICIPNLLFGFLFYLQFHFLLLTTFYWVRLAGVEFVFPTRCLLLPQLLPLQLGIT